MYFSFAKKKFIRFSLIGLERRRTRIETESLRVDMLQNKNVLLTEKRMAKKFFQIKKGDR